MKYTDSYGNICTRHVERPDVISKFFATSNVIDTHNQLRQDLLQLEKKWLTKNAYFHLCTTIIGMNVTDAYHLANYHKVINYTGGGSGEKKISLQCFAGILSSQLITNAKRWGSKDRRFLPEDAMEVEMDQALVISDLSSPSLGVNEQSTKCSGLDSIRSLVDANGKEQLLAKYTVTKDPSGRSRTKKRKCKRCLENGLRKDVSFYCISCGDRFSFCNEIGGRDRFKEHVNEIRRLTRHSTVV